SVAIYRIVKVKDKVAVMDKEWKTLANGGSYQGGNKFFSYLHQRYIGIRKEDVVAYLKAQKRHITRVPRKLNSNRVVYHTTMSKSPFVKWQMDFCEVPGHHLYILNIID